MILFFLCSISENGDLVIKQITSEMDGTFECLASNSEGSRGVKASLQVINSTTIIAGEIAKNHLFPMWILEGCLFYKVSILGVVDCMTFLVDQGL